MKKLTVEKEIINPLVVIATKQLGKTNDEIGREIGKSAMIFSQIKSQRNLAGFETLALMRKRYGLNINAIVDEDANHLFSEYNFDTILAELDQLKKEADEVKQERDFFKKIAMKTENFNETFTEDQFVDNLENLEALKDECFKIRLIGNSYYKDLSGNA